MTIVPMSDVKSPNRLRFFFERTTADHMTRKVKSLSPTATLGDLGELIERFDYNAFPVMSDEKLIGIASKFDFMRAFVFTEKHMIPDYQALMSSPVREIMNSEVVTVSPDEPLTRVLQKMVHLRTRCFPVVRRTKLVGMISRADVIEALKQSVGQR